VREAAPRHGASSYVLLPNEPRPIMLRYVEALSVVGVVFAFLLIVFLVLAFRFPDDLQKLLGRMASVEVTKDGLKIALIAQAVQEKEKRQPNDDELRPLVSEIPPDRRVLWVDDVVSNNRAEIQALRGLGLVVDTATTNAEALSYAEANKYDLVLSDITRSAPESTKAGLALPKTLRAANVDSPPIAFYVATADNPSTESGEPVFDTPTELLRWVRDELGRTSP
jgi:CheY-like chemotaxis protein